MSKPVGFPQIDCSETSIDLPYPDAGGRKDRWVEEKGETYTNLDGDILIGNRKFRYVGEYVFSSISYSDAETIKSLFNRKVLIQFTPWNDVPTVTCGCYITGFEMREDRLNRRYHLMLKVKALGLVSEKPETEISYTGRQLHRSAGTA